MILVGKNLLKIDGHYHLFLNNTCIASSLHNTALFKLDKESCDKLFEFEKGSVMKLDDLTTIIKLEKKKLKIK
jgi:hypothetical protein